ncbi:MAG: DNA sulfur modification protein DndD [Gammaproteobacteria bacterium]|nr:DNA sulfur modification protein DndD [Gammaproteobacteria bacterium]
MIFNGLELRNYGLFRKASFDLRPTQGTDHTLRNIILFGGKNGTGKTTILEALRLCLHGWRSRGVRVRRKDYEQFLRSKIHRARKGTPSPTVASVSLDFDHIHAGKRRRFRVTRKWHDTGRNVEEHLSINCDDQDDLEFDQNHWQEFLIELVPLGLAQLFFFDGEKIQALADDEAGHFELVNSMKALLGLDLTERLLADLAIYLRRQARRSDGVVGEERVVDLQDRIDAAELETRRLHQQHAQLKTRVGGIDKRISETERRVSFEGGSFAQHREELLSRRSAAEAIRDHLEEQTRALAADLLPFSLIPERCLALHRSLLAELAQQDRRAAARYLEEHMREVSVAVARLSAPDDEELALQVRSVLTAQLLPQEETTKANHPIGPELTGRLLRGIEVATQDVPHVAEKLANKLEDVSCELALVQRALNRAPRDDILRPLLSELAQLHRDRAAMGADAGELKEEIRLRQVEQTHLQRKVHRERLRLSEAEGTEARTRLTVNVQRAVSDFAVALKCLKVDEIGRHFRRCFDTLSRKDDLLHDVEVDPETFQVRFCDGAGRTLEKTELSAGEKQIYAIAMLWALALTSRRPFPFLIDTPLGRLDSDHRANLVREYFPFVSHQVVVLSTDTEIDEACFRDLLPYLARAYHLKFDDKCGETQVVDGYFWLSEENDFS